LTGTDRIGGVLPRYLAVLVAAVLGLSLFPAAANAQQQTQDPCAGAPVANEYVDRDRARDVHERNIDCVIFRSIAVGSTNAQGQQVYNPLNPVTRGQMASFISQTLVAAGYDDQLPDGEGEDVFADTETNVHRRNINRLARAEIVNGVDNAEPRPNYNPNGLVSRQQMASFIVQAAEFALGRELTSDEDFPFNDVSAGNVHRQNINRGEDNGLFRGVTANEFRPGLRVLRDQMATFLVNLLRLIFNAEQAPPVVQISDADIAPGEPVTGVIQGNARSATVSGCGLSNQTVQDRDTNTAGIQFSITIPNTQTSNCTLTFTITGADGETFTRTIQVRVTPAQQPAAATDRPDLVEAQQLRFIAENQVQNNPGFRRGANFRFVFDEAIPGACDPALFRLYDFNGREHVGTTCDRDPDSTRAVFVNFATVDTQSRFDDITIAGNLFGAVVGSGGVNPTNPDLDDRASEGDLPVGGTRQRTTQLQAGVTEAPDLTGVTVTDRSPGGTGGPTRTVVEFTFDENAFVVDPAGFQLVLTDGTTINCTGPQPTSTTEGGGTVAGGNGTTRITVICERAAGLNTSRIGAGEVARGVVQERTVSDVRQTTDTPPASNAPVPGNENPLQAVNVSNNGNVTNEPNLESVTFRNASDTDLVQFTFDRPVNPTVDGAALNAALFAVYLDSGEEIQGTAANRSPNAGEARIIFVRFNRNVEGFVGGSVEEGAVESSEAPGAGNNNSPDEEASAPRQTTTTITGGRTEGPELTQVRISEVRNQQGQLTGVRVVFVFDENVDDMLLNSNGFHVYTADGRRFTCTDARIGNPDNTSPAETRAEVVCTNFTTTQSPTPSQGDIRDAVLTAVRGTVEPGVVDERGSGTRRNPVGAEGITR